MNRKINMRKCLFTSESVTEGHPDKVCDAISDAILDNLLEQDPESHVACETLATKGMITVAGEVRTRGFCEVEKIAKRTLEEIGYIDADYGMNSDETRVFSMLHSQSNDIAVGVDEVKDHEQGAGDQGLMFGYACTETPELMPLPIMIAHALTRQLTKQRKQGSLSWLRPDGKSQVTVEYQDHKPISVKKVVIATQHDDILHRFSAQVKERDFIESEVTKKVIIPVLEKFGIQYENDFIVNGTGRFVTGGPEADTGLTGRKIIVDTYGGYAPHGGGAFSGKDPSKVDRSATYMTRYIAKNIVAAELAERCEVQLSYSIGVAEPTSLSVKTFNTGIRNDDELTEIVQKIFPLKPKEIIDHLKLKRPIYRSTSAYGHFGRNEDNFTWEKTDKVDELKNYFN